MMVKILIQRKVKPGKEQEFKRIVRELFTRAIHAEGFISGETMRSVEDPTTHLTIGTWSNKTSLNNWLNDPKRKEAQERLDQVLAEPVKMTSFQYE